MNNNYNALNMNPGNNTDYISDIHSGKNSSDDSNNSSDCRNTETGRSTARKYADIIHLSRPISHRPHMDLVQRAKIFSPYDTLRGFDESIDNANAQLNEVSRQELSDEEKEKISAQLSQLRRGVKIRAEYFLPDNVESPDNKITKTIETGESRGTYITEEGTVTAIDPISQTIEMKKTNDAAARTGFPGANEDPADFARTPPTVIPFENLQHLEIL